ncbi:MAG TPA: ATP-binding protein [Polyangia bacterium]|jgi:light-regulated signal transduction histidine kinase (bacteriophytochrome)|nr:ATP-binding protein [Polyangia bacterium]
MPRPSEHVDLTHCDREPIHIPGSIQPHGVLLTVTGPALTVAQASTNTAALLGLEHGAVLGASLERLLDAPSLARLREALASRPTGRASASPIRVNGHPFEAILHRSEGLLVAELEPPLGPDADPLGGALELNGRAHEVLQRLQRVHGLSELWPTLAEVIYEFTGFDRVMVYRFSEQDDSGEVIAEARRADVEPYLGLRYPASDIPQQARRLYVLNRLRLIQDAAYTPAPIAPADNPLTGRPLDLSQAVLRSVSPIHCEYLANMGVRASMSISLLQGDRLWGLIACHHYAPRLVPYRVRMLCELLGEVVSWLLGPRLAAEESDARVRASAIQMRLVEAMSREADLVTALIRGVPSALELVRARGFAVVYEGRVGTTGETPSIAEIAGLAEWLHGTQLQDVYATDALPEAYAPARAFAEVASGLLAALVSRAHGMSLLWFRPEVIREVRWGGDPHKAIAADGERLVPRKSFALWKETVRGRSQPWAPWEVEAAAGLRNVTAGVVLQKAAEIFHLNLDLQRALETRDDFLSIAAHELRTPLATLRLQLDSLRRLSEKGALDPARVKARLDGADRQLERLDALIQHLLDVSQIAAGQVRLERARCDLTELARGVIERFQEQAAPIQLVASGDLVGSWDPFRLDQVVTNLLSNALKYGEGKPVVVALEDRGKSVRCAVHDQGIGISPEAQARIFERFERAVSSSHFAGFGLGLWIARRIVEQHGGNITVASVPGAGATFAFELPRGPIPEAASGMG